MKKVFVDFDAINQDEVFSVVLKEIDGVNGMDKKAKKSYPMYCYAAAKVRPNLWKYPGNIPRPWGGIFPNKI